MNKNSNAFTLLFAIAVCVTMAILLAATFNSLHATIDANAEFDKNRSVLLATGLVEKSTTRSQPDLEKLFEQRIRGKVLEVKRAKVAQKVKRAGKEVEEQVDRVVELIDTQYTLKQLDQLRRDERRKPAAQRKEYAPLYQALGENGETVAWCIPISGYGLWSTLYGFLALKPDLRHVRGITFYKHGETPGLGGEVDNFAWQESWEDKAILDEQGHVIGITVKKGIVNEAVPSEKAHMVDGLSGATITSNGVTRFVLADLTKYEPYFAKLRKP
jgi:Na+-transporting NADH:ubiquinone oxidoreductase subunit C